VVVFAASKKSAGKTFTTSKLKDSTKKKDKGGKRKTVKDGETRSPGRMGRATTVKGVGNLSDNAFVGQVFLRNCRVTESQNDYIVTLQGQDITENYQLMFENKPMKISWHENICRWKKIIEEPELTLIEGISSTKLKVRLMAGRNLQKFHFDAPDIQIIFYVGSSTAESAIKRKMRVNPQWDDEFVFVLNDLFTEKLNILVRDISKNEKLGETFIDLITLFSDVETRLWCDLTPKGSVYLSLTVGSNL